MKIVPLDPALEPQFWELVNEDVPHYFFFALDWHTHRSDTEILLALNQDRIDGMMLIFKERIVQLRGSRKSAETLLERLELSKAEFQVSQHHKESVMRKYQPTWSHELVLMMLQSGEERLRIAHPIVPLDSSDAEPIAAMMTTLDPEIWGEVTREKVVEGMNTDTWVGIREREELVSIGRARLTENVGIIHTIATHPGHRNKGYATSITSFLVRHILDTAPTALIYTLRDNPPANRVYRKVGFTPYKQYLIMKAERR
jgi:predicted GNAT family acetyltransferase